MVIAFGVGIFLAWYSYQRISNPEPAIQREREEAVVMLSREIVRQHLGADPRIELADPLAPNRVAGKVYIYPTDTGWEISGHYWRRNDDRWHPYLMSLDREGQLESLAVRDSDQDLIEAAADNPLFSVQP